jgi:hypothetical protein
VEVTSPAATADSEPPRPPSGRELRRRLFPSKTVVVALLLVTVVLPSALVLLQIRDNPALSPFDEFAHLDYVMKVSRGQIPRTGQHVDPATLRIMACRKIDYPGVQLPNCHDKKLTFDRFPGDAFNHEAQQPPLYYAITAGLRRVVQDVSGESYLTSARSTGVAWLILALFTTWVAGTLLGVRPWALLAALLVLTVAPTVVYFSAIVSNDATALFSGAVVLAAAVWFGPTPTRWASATLFGIGFAVAWLKPTNVFAAATVALWLLVRAYQERDGRTTRELLRTWLRSGGALVAGAAVAALGWVAISGWLAFVDAQSLPIFAVRHLEGVHLDLFLAQAASLLSAPTGSLPSGSFSQPIQLFTSELIRDLFVVAAAVGIFVARRAWYHVLGLVAIVVFLAGGLALGISIWVSLHMDPGVVPRYGLSVLPLLAVCLAQLAERGRVVWLIGGVGAVTAVTTLWVLA